MFKDLKDELNIQPETITMSDGYKIDSFFLRNQKNDPESTTVIISHGRDTNKDWLLPMAKALSKEYNVLLYDIRAHGQKNNWWGVRTTMGLQESKDLEEILKYVETSKGSDKVALYGFSIGATTSLLTAANHEGGPEIVSVTAHQPYPTVYNIFGNLGKAVRVPKYFYNLLTRVVSKWAGYDLDEVNVLDALGSIQKIMYN